MIGQRGRAAPLRLHVARRRVDVRVETRRDAEDLPQVELSSLTPTDLYTRYYQQAHGSAPTPETLAVFREVLEEATVQTS